MLEKFKSPDAQTWAGYDKSWEMFLRQKRNISFSEFVSRQRDPRFKAFAFMKHHAERCGELRAWLETNKDKVGSDSFEAGKRDLAFYERAAQYYEGMAHSAVTDDFLSGWEAGLPPALREKLRDVRYLPTHAEVLQIPKMERENSWRRDFFDHEVWNREYVEALADHIIEAARRSGVASNAGGKFVVVEAGAGSGRLSYFLRQIVGARLIAPAKMEIIAIDKTLEHALPEAEVEEIKIKEAGEKYKPDMVICSWPASIQQDIAEIKSVREFIFIGESELVPFYDRDGENEFVEFAGFKSRELTGVKKWQTGIEKGCTTVAWVRE